jgi:hypothetical protein
LLIFLLVTLSTEAQEHTNSQQSGFDDLALDSTYKINLCLESIDDFDSVKVPFSNFGLNTIHEADFYYSALSGGSFSGVVNWNGSLPKESTAYFHIHNIQLNQFGSYTYSIVGELGGGRVDAVPENDTMILELNVLKTPAIPSSQTFFKCAEDSLILDLTSPEIDSFSWSNTSLVGNPVFSNAGDYSVTVTGNNGCQNSETYSIINYPEPQNILPFDTFFCEGSSIEILADSNFTNYQWPGFNHNGKSITVNEPGSYTVDIQDTNGCGFSDEIIVHEIPLPNVSIPDVINGCQGDSIFINAANGNSNTLYYEWDDGTKNHTNKVTKSGIYKVSVENIEGCTSSDSVYVDLKSLPSIKLPDTSWMCNGAPELISIQGNSSNFYSWDSGENGMSILVEEEGTYHVNAQDSNGCMNDESVIVQNEIVANNIESDTILCEGDGFSVSPDSGFVSFWEDGFSNHERFITQPGDYIFTVEGKHGCINKDTLSVKSKTVPETNFDFIVGGANVNFNNLTTNFDSLLWNFGDGQSSSQNSPTHSYNESGNYKVVLTTYNICGQSNFSQIINFTSTGIKEIFNDESIKLYPNPVLQGNKIKILLSDLSNKDLTLRVYSSIGQLLLDRSIGLTSPNQIVSINTNQFSSGNYIVHLTIDSESVTKMVNIVKRK